MQKENDFDKEMPQPQTSDKPTALTNPRHCEEMENRTQTAKAQLKYIISSLARSLSLSLSLSQHGDGQNRKDIKK